MKTNDNYLAARIESLDRQLYYCKFAIGGLVLTMFVGVAVGLSRPPQASENSVNNQITLQDDERKIVISPEGIRLYTITPKGDAERLVISDNALNGYPGMYVTFSPHSKGKRFMAFD